MNHEIVYLVFNWGLMCIAQLLLLENTPEEPLLSGCFMLDMQLDFQSGYWGWDCGGVVVTVYVAWGGPLTWDLVLAILFS